MYPFSSMVRRLVPLSPTRYHRDPLLKLVAAILCGALSAFRLCPHDVQYCLHLAPSKDLNPVTGSLELEVGLKFPMELIVIVAFTVVGLATLGIQRQAGPSRHVRVRSTRASHREAGAVKGEVDLGVERALIS